MVPVAMPGTADGSVCRQVVCQTVAPSASEPYRISLGHRAHGLAGGDDDDRQDQQGQRDAPPITTPVSVKPTSASAATASRP